MFILQSVTNATKVVSQEGDYQRVEQINSVVISSSVPGDTEVSLTEEILIVFRHLEKVRQCTSLLQEYF